MLPNKTLLSKTLRAAKESLFDKNLLLPDKMLLYRKAKSEKQENTLEMIDICLRLTNACSKTKDPELKECLLDLKSYLSKLNNETEKHVDETSWNYAIQHFSANKEYESESLYWFKRIMKEKKIATPSIYTLSLILKPFSNIGDEEVCEEIVRKLERDGKSSTYSYMYFVNACLNKGNLEKAFSVVLEMKKKSIEPFVSTYIALLKEATRCKKLNVGLKIIDLIKSSNTCGNQVSMHIISFALKMNKPTIAFEECEKLRDQGALDVVSWNCFIQTHIQMNETKKAIKMIDEMEQSNIKPNSTTFTIILTACAKSNLFEEGKLIHEKALSTIHDFSIELSTAVINLYTKCGHAEIAIKECEHMRRVGSMNIVSWTCLVQAYIQMNEIKKAIKIVDEMEQSNIKPNSKTFTIILTACANSNLYEEGKLIHEKALAIIQDFSIELSTAVINFYTKCGHAEIAIKECEHMRRNGLMNIVSWTCLVQAHIRMNEIKKAINIIDEMENSGIIPNSTTITIILTACAKSNLFEEGKLIHEKALSTIQDFSIELSTAVINFYTKCGHVEIAIKECENMRRHKSLDIISWNCIIQAYVLYDLNKAILVFEEMKMENISPDKFTYVILLSGCGEHVATSIGNNIIAQVKQHRMHIHEEILSVMVYFYSRIGEDKIAVELFDTLKEKLDGNLSIITYNNMLACYAQHGKGVEARMLFNEMVKKKIELNEQTFTIMLNAYSHCGMIKDAIQLFNQIKSVHGQDLSIITITAMVDVFARAGKFKEAEQLIDGKRDFILWNILMGACRKFNNVEFGEKVFRILLSLDEKQASPYILMSHIYTFHNMNEKANILRILMEKNDIKKVPGIVYLEENGKVFTFISGSSKYEKYQETVKMREEIYRKIIQAGHVTDTRWSTNPKLLREDEKIDSLCKHAEKTAIAHAFVLNPTRKKIVLTKNLRVCNDCHCAIAFISKVMNVEIIVRDAYRYHHFKDGKWILVEPPPEKGMWIMVEITEWIFYTINGFLLTLFGEGCLSSWCYFSTNLLRTTVH